MAKDERVDWDIDNNIPATDPRSPHNPMFFCPRGIKTEEEHRRRFLTHRRVDGCTVCMNLDTAIQYDESRK